MKKVYCWVIYHKKIDWRILRLRVNHDYYTLLDSDDMYIFTDNVIYIVWITYNYTGNLIV